MKFKRASQAEEELKKAKNEWEEVVEKGKEMREKKLLDYYYEELEINNKQHASNQEEALAEREGWKSANDKVRRLDDGGVRKNEHSER